MVMFKDREHNETTSLGINSSMKTTKKNYPFMSRDGRIPSDRYHLQRANAFFEDFVQDIARNFPTIHIYSSNIVPNSTTLHNSERNRERSWQYHLV